MVVAALDDANKVSSLLFVEIDDDVEKTLLTAGFFFDTLLY